MRLIFCLPIYLFSLDSVLSGHEAASAAASCYHERTDCLQLEPTRKNQSREVERRGSKWHGFILYIKLCLKSALKWHFFSCYKEQQTISNQNSLNIYTSFYYLFNFIVFPDIASHSLRIFYSLLEVEIWSTFEQRLNLFNSYPSWCNSVPESLK